MPTTPVTKELSTIIRDLRKATNTTSKDIADLINKSTGFVSNLENGKTSFVDCSLVIAIFNFLVDKDPSLSSRIESFLDNDLKIDFSEDEIKERDEKHKLYILFDKQYRTIRIEKSLVQYFENELKSLGVSAADVIKELNSNKSISNPNDYDKNVLLVNPFDDGWSETIVFELQESFLNDILRQKIRHSKYIYLLGVVYAIQLLKGFDFETAHTNAHQILYNHKIYTLPERNELMKQEEINGIVLDIKRYDRSSSKLPENLIIYFETVSNLVDILNTIKERDIDYTVSRLIPLLKNLSNRKLTSMTLAMIGLSLEPLQSFSAKEQISLFNEIKKLINERVQEKENSIDIIKFE